MLRRLLTAALCAASLVVPSVSASDGPITRRDGFVLLWAAIHRPADAAKGKPYADVPRASAGGAEITFAKSRGILEDAALFHPDDALTLQDALVWMLRTRNVADADAVSTAALPSLLKRYPVATALSLAAWSPEMGSGALMARAGSTLVTPAQLQAMSDELTVLLQDETHEVSLYSEKFNGKGTAFGETFDMNALTAAHRTFPQNTLVRVTNIANGKSVTVRINDRGPYVAGRDMDLSLAAFLQIADRKAGKIRARFDRIGDASMAGPCSATPQQMVRVTKDVILTKGVPNYLHLGDTLTLQSGSDFRVDTVTAPDGSSQRPRQWVAPGGQYTLQPALTGTYRLLLGTKDGHQRAADMTVLACAAK
jgi:hypothetical protein